MQFQATARKFAREEIIPIAAECDRTGAYPTEAIKKAHALGILNKNLPAEFGGFGLGALSGCLITEQLAYGCTGIQVSIDGTLLGVRFPIVNVEFHDKL